MQAAQSWGPFSEFALFREDRFIARWPQSDGLSSKMSLYAGRCDGPICRAFYANRAGSQDSNQLGLADVQEAA